MTNKLNLTEMNKLKELQKKHDEERSKIEIDYIKIKEETLLESCVWRLILQKPVLLEPKDLDYLEKLSLKLEDLEKTPKN